MIHRVHKIFLKVFAALVFPHLIFVIPISAELSPQDAKSKLDLHEYSDMVEISEGKFKMGFNFKEVSKVLKWCQKVDKKCVRWWFKDAFPSRLVYLDSYWIDIYEVTNEKYREFVLATGHRPALDSSCKSDKCWENNLWKGNDFHKDVRLQPVTQVSWFDADAYCKWRGKRLPTEAEWEKAARGPTGNMFPWGNDMPPGRATYRRKWRGIHTMTDVGSYPTGVSIYGVHDMAGNVWEWVADWYDHKYYQKKINKNPKGPENGELKVVRGGSWVNFKDSLLSAFRRWTRPEERYSDTGFRCAKDPINETKTDG